ncbi:MAG: hypothetical protein WAX89_05830 [Alphaproteobacteria bacterium]
MNNHNVISLADVRRKLAESASPLSPAARAVLEEVFLAGDDSIHVFDGMENAKLPLTRVLDMLEQRRNLTEKQAVMDFVRSMAEADEPPLAPPPATR